MNLPKQIFPDRIKDAVVEFSIDYVKPYEVILGFVLDEVIQNNLYKYVNSSNNIPLEIQELTGKRYIFYNDKIKFHLSPKTITINCFNSYISWELYSKEIKDIINLVYNISSDIKVKRIGLRYVSEYKDVDLNDSLKFEFTFGYPNIKSKHYSFNSEFSYKEALVILTLRNLMPTNVSNESQNLSHIDIDVIKKDLELPFSTNDALMNTLDEIHKYEKEIFFNLLKETFLQKLKPIY